MAALSSVLCSKRSGRLGVTCINHPTRPNECMVSSLCAGSVATTAGLRVGAV